MHNLNMKMALRSDSRYAIKVFMTTQVYFLLDNCWGSSEIIIKRIHSQYLELGSKFEYQRNAISTRKVYVLGRAHRRHKCIIQAF